MTAPVPPDLINRLFDALGERNRRSILDLLAATPLSISDLAAALGVTKTAIGQHISILESASLVTSEKRGRVRMCRIDMGGFRVLQSWVDQHASHWQQGLDRLGDLLDGSRP